MNFFNTFPGIEKEPVRTPNYIKSPAPVRHRRFNVIRANFAFSPSFYKRPRLFQPLSFVEYKHSKDARRSVDFRVMLPASTDPRPFPLVTLAECRFPLSPLNDALSPNQQVEAEQQHEAVDQPADPQEGNFLKQSIPAQRACRHADKRHGAELHNLQINVPCQQVKQDHDTPVDGKIKLQSGTVFVLIRSGGKAVDNHRRAAEIKKAAAQAADGSGNQAVSWRLGNRDAAAVKDKIDREQYQQQTEGTQHHRIGSPYHNIDADKARHSGGDEWVKHPLEIDVPAQLPCDE